VAPPALGAAFVLAISAWCIAAFDLEVEYSRNPSELRISGDSIAGGFSGGGNSGAAASVYSFSYNSLQQSPSQDKISTVFRRY
jgi:hypothetical protein